MGGIGDGIIMYGPAPQDPIDREPSVLPSPSDHPPLVPCPKCKRHIFLGSVCPFCPLTPEPLDDIIKRMKDRLVQLEALIRETEDLVEKEKAKLTAMALERDMMKKMLHVVEPPPVEGK